METDKTENICYKISIVFCNNIEQTVNTYNLIACNKALVKTNKDKLKQQRLT